MKKIDIKKLIKRLIILLVVGLVLCMCYMLLGSTTVKVVSQTDNIKLDKVKCIYPADPPVEMKIIKDISNHVFFQKGMRHGRFYYYINVFDGNRIHLIKLTEFKSNWYQKSYIKIYIDELNKPNIHVRVTCNGIERVNEKFDATLDEIDVGSVE